jgi:hypothetical protein
MRLHFDFSEWDKDPEPNQVQVTVNIPDGSSHERVTAVFEKTLSMFMGYNINVSNNSQFEFKFDDEDLSDDEYAACPNCVQGTCVSGCGREFT